MLGFPETDNSHQLYDHSLTAELLAGMEPWWEAGSAPGYRIDTRNYTG